MKRTLSFAHRIPRSLEGGLLEFLADVQVLVVAEERGLRATAGLPDALEYGRMRPNYSQEAFPALLERLLRETGEGAVLEARIPAELLAWIQRRAPRTWELLQSQVDILQRDEAFVLTVTDTSLEISWRPDGALRAEELRCPLLDLCAELAYGRLPFVSSTVAPGPALTTAQTLVRELLITRWVSRRLSPGLYWDSNLRVFALRGAPEAVRVQEELAPAQPGVPGKLLLSLPGYVQAFELDVDPHDDLPLPVIRRGLSWLLDPYRSAATLFLDARGRTPAERPDCADSSSTV